MQPLSLTASTAVSALGAGREALRAALHDRRGGLRPGDFPGGPEGAWLGRVPGLEEVALPPGLSGFACRNNRLAEMALATDRFADAVEAARERYGPERVAVCLGTSTAGIEETERAYRRRRARRRAARRLRFRAHARPPVAAALRARASACAARRWPYPPPAPPARAPSWRPRC
jgi:3-oxoacyl-[acyl-carrier-protein] synthase-1